MPNIASFKGVRVNIYNGEHLPPHIHAIYNEYEMLIEIESGKPYAGSLPARQHRYAIKWLEENREWVKSVYYELNPKLR